MRGWPARSMSSAKHKQLASDLSDEALAVLARNGVRQAFDRLMRRHSRTLVRFLSRQVGGKDDAEDVAQNTFIAIHRNLDRFDETKSFLTWMFFIARNKVRDHHRRRQVLRWVGYDDALDDIPSSEADPEMIASDRAELERAGDFIRQMPEGLRTPLLLSAMDGMSLAQIGQVMGISAKAAEVRVYRARKRLKEQFFGEGLV
jgi:RNA polymerase sigma factor (sigma-70 family)